MSVNVRELLVGFGKGKQTDISTANLVGATWRLNKLNTAPLNPQYITEDDAAEAGKGHEFATQTFKSHVLVGPHSIEKYISSEWVAWCAAFGLGNVVKTGTTNLVYTCTPTVPATSGIELPYFSYIEQTRPGGSAIFDNMYVGCRLKSFMASIQSGPGRSASKMTAEFVGSGLITTPSAITLPARTAEKELPGASLALTILGTNYVTLKSIVSLDWGWDNAPREETGFFPGSGTQAGYAVKGRIENGDRIPMLKFVTRVRVGAPEFTTLQDLTTGTAVITQTFDANNSYTATFQQMGFRVVELGETNGLMTLSVEASPQFHASNGVLTVVANTNIDGICQ